MSEEKTDYRLVYPTGTRVSIISPRFSMDGVCLYTIGHEGTVRWDIEMPNFNNSGIPVLFDMGMSYVIDIECFVVIDLKHPQLVNTGAKRLNKSEYTSDTNKYQLVTDKGLIKWEYNFILLVENNVPLKAWELDDKLKEHGQHGWELAGFYNGLAWLKRPQTW